MAKTRTVVRYVGRRRRARRLGRRFTVPVSIVAGILPGAWRLWEHRQNFSTFTNEAGRIYLGYDSWTGAWSFGSMRFGTLPLILAAGVHYAANRLGLNRAIGRMIPIVRI